LNLFLQRAAEKKYSKNGAARKFFGPSYFDPTLGIFLILTYVKFSLVFDKLWINNNILECYYFHILLICIWSIGWSMDTDFAKISTQYHQSEFNIEWRRIKSEKREKIKLRRKKKSEILEKIKLRKKKSGCFWPLLVWRGGYGVPRPVAPRDSALATAIIITVLGGYRYRYFQPIP
jgi:hypothetical protein